MNTYEFDKLIEAMWRGIANILPKRLVYWATIRLIAHATTGKYSNTHVPTLTVIDALNCWSQKEKDEHSIL